MYMKITIGTNLQNIRALTLIEALIWFAIFAAVVAGVFSLYSNSRDANNASTTNKELSIIYSQTTQLFQHDDTTDLETVMALNLGIFPKSLKVTPDGVVSNVFGGTVTIIGRPPSGFTVIYTKIPAGDICSNIVAAQKNIGWDTVLSINYDSTYSIDKVATACGNNGTGIKNITLVKVQH